MAEAVDLKKWYVVRAVSGQENKIRDYMESEINRLGLSIIWLRIFWYPH